MSDRAHIGLAIVGIAAGIGTWIVSELGVTLPDTVLWIALFVCGALVVWGLWPWISVWRMRSPMYRASSKVRTHEPTNAVEFFATLDDLQKRQSLDDTFKPGNEIHALLLTGERIILENEDYIKYVKRLILPDPHEDNFRDLAKQTHDYHGAKRQFASQVQAALNKAKGHRIEVRTTDNFVGCSMIFCNPESNGGWALIGLIIPGTTPAKRQHYRLYKAIHEEAFRVMYDTFERLWDPLAEREMREGYEQA